MTFSIPGSFVNITGKLVSTRYGSNEAESQNKRTVKFLRYCMTIKKSEFAANRPTLIVILNPKCFIAVSKINHFISHIFAF